MHIPMSMCRRKRPVHGRAHDVRLPRPEDHMAAVVALAEGGGDGGRVVRDAVAMALHRTLPAPLRRPRNRESRTPRPGADLRPPTRAGRRQAEYREQSRRLHLGCRARRVTGNQTAEQNRARRPCLARSSLLHTGWPFEPRLRPSILAAMNYYRRRRGAATGGEKPAGTRVLLLRVLFPPLSMVGCTPLPPSTLLSSQRCVLGDEVSPSPRSVCGVASAGDR